MKSKGILDPITLEVVQSFLINTVNEMRVAMMHSTYAPVLSETEDFSCGLLNRRGELLAMTVDISFHIFPTVFHAQLALERYKDEIYPGDVFICNDPYTGGPHLNDVLILYPYFDEGTLAFFIAVRAHWTDVGGRGGIVGQCREIYEEGVRLPLMKIYDRGEINQALTTTLFANVRNSEERIGDFLAMVGACKSAEVRLRDLLARYSGEVVEDCVNAILDRSEKVVRAAIADLPDGEYYYETYLENSGTATDPMPVRCKMTIQGDEMTFDFTGSSPQVAGPVNSGPASPYTAVFIMLKSYIESATPVNGGPMRPITITLPENSFLNSRLPAPAGGYGEVIYVCEQVVLGLLGQVMPEKVGALPESGANHCYVTGFDFARDQHWILYDFPRGGTPASPETDGSNAVWTYDLGDMVVGVPVERIDLEQPLQVMRNELRQDSGGLGFRRGGLGVRREIKVLDPAGCFLTVLTELCVLPRAGMAAGYPSALNSFTVFRDGVEIQPSDVPGKVAGFPMIQGDILVEQARGGGGYGDPLDREIERVREDVALRYISERQAQEGYGVVFKAGEVDIASTKKLRANMKESRVHVVAARVEADQYDDIGRRLFQIGPDLARHLDVENGDMIEYVPDRGPHVEAWVKVDPNLNGERSPIGPIGMGILQLKDGDSVWVRPLCPSG